MQIHSPHVSTTVYKRSGRIEVDGKVVVVCDKPVSGFRLTVTLQRLVGDDWLGVIREQFTREPVVGRDKKARKRNTYVAFYRGCVPGRWRTIARTKGIDSRGRRSLRTPE